MTRPRRVFPPTSAHGIESCRGDIVRHRIRMDSSKTCLPPTSSHGRVSQLLFTVFKYTAIDCTCQSVRTKGGMRKPKMAVRHLRLHVSAGNWHTKQ